VHRIRLPRAGLPVDTRHLRAGRDPGRRQLDPGQPPERGDRDGTPPPWRAGVSLVEAVAGRRQPRGRERYVTLRTAIAWCVILAGCGRPRTAPAPAPAQATARFEVLGDAS